MFDIINTIRISVESDLHGCLIGVSYPHLFNHFLKLCLIFKMCLCQVSV